MLSKRYSVLLLFLLFTTSLFSQSSNLTILCVAAHPDDEDGATLAYYTKLKSYNAYTVFYTRGEGGQNEIGPELNDQLGIIREQECRNAAAITGTKPLFLGERDFGFSKTAKETFKMWGGEDSVLARIVYFIRQIKPDVVISNHDTITTKPNRQHGNHQAVGITIYEAFDKAADRNYHPEQLHDGITPWQIKKLYFLVYDTTRTDRIFTIDVNKTDPVSGKTINQIAIEALSQHKTQGMDKIDWSTVPEVRRLRHYELIRSDNMYPIEGDDLFIGLEQTDKNVNPVYLDSYQTVYNYNRVNPQDSINTLNTLKWGYYFNISGPSRGYIDIGLIKSYDNTIQNILDAFKIKYDTLSANDFNTENLRKYNVVMVDIRAYLYRSDLLQYKNELLNYVQNGGNIICFYNKPSDLNGKDVFPYPLFITSERVTEEDAKVTVLQPNNPFLNTPNQITDSDWNGWVQERSIYLPSDDTSKTSSKYSRLLAMHDEDDPVPSTSLLFANYGRGTYSYCSLALYRQLKVFHKGALKLFLNMVSFGNADVRILQDQQ